MASPISKKPWAASHACSLCCKVLGNKSYTKATWAKHGIYEDMFEEIGYTMDNLQYICKPCERLFAKRLKIESDYENKHTIISHLLNSKFQPSSSQCSIPTNITASNHGNTTPVATPKKPPRSGQYQVTPVKARKKLFKVSKRSLSKTPRKDKVKKIKVYGRPILPKPATSTSPVKKDAEVQVQQIRSDAVVQNVVEMKNKSTETETFYHTRTKVTQTTVSW